MIEGQFGAVDELSPGNFELCVAVGGQVQHWWQSNSGDRGWQTEVIVRDNNMKDVLENFP